MDRLRGWLRGLRGGPSGQAEKPRPSAAPPPPSSPMEEKSFTLSLPAKVSRALKVVDSDDFDERITARATVGEYFKSSYLFWDGSRLWYVQGGAKLSSHDLDGQQLDAQPLPEPLIPIARTSEGALLFKAERSRRAVLATPSEDILDLSASSPWSRGHDSQAFTPGLLIVRLADVPWGGLGKEPPLSRLGHSWLKVSMEGRSLRVEICVVKLPGATVISRRQTWTSGGLELVWQEHTQPRRDPGGTHVVEDRSATGGFQLNGQPVSVTRCLTVWSSPVDFERTETVLQADALVSDLVWPSLPVAFPLGETADGLPGSTRAESGWRRLSLSLATTPLHLLEDFGKDRVEASPETRLTWIGQGLPPAGDLAVQRLPLARTEGLWLDLLWAEVGGHFLVSALDQSEGVPVEILSVYVSAGRSNFPGCSSRDEYPKPAQRAITMEDWFRPRLGEGPLTWILGVNGLWHSEQHELSSQTLPGGAIDYLQLVKFVHDPETRLLRYERIDCVDLTS